MAKRTLERLADPVKGRHESPNREEIQMRQYRSARREYAAPPKCGGGSQKKHYHSPLGEEDRRDRCPSPITTPRKKQSGPGRGDAACTFLTGMGLGDSDDEPDQHSLAMDVRVNISKSDRDVSDMYSPRSKQYMKDVEMEAHQEELLRQVRLSSPRRTHQSLGDKTEQSRPRRQGVKTITKKKTSSSRAVPSMGQRSKTKSKSTKSRVRLDNRGPSGGGGVSTGHPRVPSQKVSLASVRTTKRTSQPQRGAGGVVDPVLGLERVDNSMRDGSKLLRSTSGGGGKSYRQMSGKNAIGTRSAPSITSKAKFVGAIEEDSTTESMLRRPPVGNARRLLGRVSGSQKSAKIYADKLQRSGVGAVRLQPIVDEKTVGSSVSKKGLLSRRKQTSAAEPVVAVSAPRRQGAGVLSRSSSTKSGGGAKQEPNDDQIAALFMAHSKKLTANLQKADDLSLQYKHLRDFDGFLYASRHNVDACLPKEDERFRRSIVGKSGS